MSTCDGEGLPHARWQMKEEYQQVKESDYSVVCRACEAAFAVLGPLLAPAVQDKDWFAGESPVEGH